MAGKLDRSVVACNYVASTSVAAEGARAYLVSANPGDGDERIRVLVRSRSGRWVVKWESIRHLGNFRRRTIPPEHPMHPDRRLHDHEPDAMAARLEKAAENAKSRGEAWRTESLIS